MHRLFALTCVVIALCETGCAGSRHSHYSSCVPDACGGCDTCGSCGDVACSHGGGGRHHRSRRAPLFGRGGSLWGGYEADGCESACGGCSSCGGCGVPMEGMTYSGGCSCGQGQTIDGMNFSTTNSLVPSGPVPQQVYSPAVGAPPPAPPMEPAPAPAPPMEATPTPAPGRIAPMSAEYFHPQATLVPPGASPTSLQAPPLMQMQEMPAAMPQPHSPLQMPAQGTIVPASSAMPAPVAMPPAQPVTVPPLLWVPSGVQQ